MDEKLAMYEQQRQAINKKARLFMALAVLSIIIFLAIGILANLIFLAFIGFIACLIFVGIGSAPINKFNKTIKSDIINEIIQNELEDGIYDPNRGFPLDVVLDGGFLPKPDRYHSEDYVKGTYNDVTFEMADAKLEEKHVSTDSRGHRHVSYVTYFNGRYMVFDFKRDLNMIVQILEKPLTYIKGLTKIETESIEFNKKFKVYATSQQDAAYILTPTLMLKIQELEQKYRGTIYFSFINGKLFVGINDNSNSFEVSIKQKLDEAFIEIIKGQINIAPAIISEFKLDKSKFSDTTR